MRLDPGLQHTGQNQEMNVCIPYAQNVFKWQGLEGRFLKGKIAISR